MKFIVVYILLLLLSGCASDKVSDVLLQELKGIIDDNESEMKYLLAYQMSDNDNGMIFQLFYSDIPCFEATGERPASMIGYKDKCICLFFIRNKSYADGEEWAVERESHSWDDRIWYIGVSQDGEQCDVMEASKSYRLAALPYHFPVLLKYIYEEYSEDNIPRFVLEDYECMVDDQYESRQTIKEHFLQLSGTIYFSNPQDDYFSGKEEESFFGTLNGKDTLKFFMSDDTVYQRLFIDSVYVSSFMENLLSDDTWCLLHQLLEDSTFYFRKRGDVLQKTPVPYSGIPPQIYVNDKDGNIKDEWMVH